MSRYLRRMNSLADAAKKALACFLCAAAVAAVAPAGSLSLSARLLLPKLPLKFAVAKAVPALEHPPARPWMLIEFPEVDRTFRTSIYPKISVFKTGRKYTYSMLEKDIKDFFVGGLCSYDVIGKSIQGRNIYALQAGSGPVKVLITAGVHARETANTPMVMQCMFDMLNMHEKGDARTAELFKKVTFIVVPLVNPDGYEECLQKNRGTKKTNARGVDINRNFPYKYWGSRITKPGNGYPGPQPGSEPETQAIMTLIGAHEFSLCVDIHSRGRLLFCQKGGLTAEDITNGRSPDELNAISQTLAQTLRLQVNYKIAGEAKVVFGEEGTLTDYAFSQGIPTITFETLKGGVRLPASSKLIKSEYAYFNWPNVFCEIGLFAAGLE